MNSTRIQDNICRTCYHPKNDAHNCKHPDCDICNKCFGTGKITGAQDWSERGIKKRGSPYYTADCDCVAADSKKPHRRG